MPEYTAKTMKVVLEIKCINTKQSLWYASCGKVMAYIQKDTSLNLQKGSVLVINGTPSLPPSIANPAQFDYAQYLKRQNIYATHYIRKNTLVKIGQEKGNYLIALADRFRNFCDGKIKEGIEGENEYGMTSALLLGVRAGLDEKLYEAYSSTGTVHALAVSGLHVSLIYFIVIMVLGFLKKLPYGKFIFTVVSILIFWFYALVTGFSPSVVRAVAMFSIFLIAGVLKRHSGIYNTLAFSAFFILCFEPFWLLDIGFQFSFLAVVGIAYFYPMLYGWLTLKNKIAEKLWALVCVSLAAQLAVSPLSIYYFHSFPLLFLPFNMLIVPLSSLALYTGLGALMVYKIEIVSNFLFLVTAYIVRFMNYIVQLPSGSDFLKLDYLYLSPVELAILYLGIVFFFIALKNRRYSAFIYSVTFFFFFFVSFSYTKYLENSKHEVTFYTIKDRTVLSLIHSGNAVVLSDSILTMNDKIFRYNIYNHLAQKRINTVSFVSFQDTTLLAIANVPFGQLLVWQGVKILRRNKVLGAEAPRYFLDKMDYVIGENNNLLFKR